MDKPEPTFTIDDLLAELRPDDVPDGVTVRELCERNGKPPTKNNKTRAQKKVADLIALGLWEYVGQKQSTSITGAVIAVPAYRPKGGG